MTGRAVWRRALRGPVGTLVLLGILIVFGLSGRLAASSALTSLSLASGVAVAGHPRRLGLSGRLASTSSLTSLSMASMVAVTRRPHYLRPQRVSGILVLIVYGLIALHAFSLKILFHVIYCIVYVYPLLGL